MCKLFPCDSHFKVNHKSLILFPESSSLLELLTELPNIKCGITILCPFESVNLNLMQNVFKARPRLPAELQLLSAFVCFFIVLCSVSHSESHCNHATVHLLKSARSFLRYEMSCYNYSIFLYSCV